MRTLFFIYILIIVTSILANSIEKNTSILSGSIDIITIQNSDELKSTPFHVRFGIFVSFDPLNADVNIIVNGKKSSITMKLTNEGDAYFPGNTEKFTPSSDQLKSFNLNNGKNVIKFRISGFLHHFRTLTSYIYLWDSNTKIVVSDIDGTITQSDALGLVLPFFGIDWSQTNITKFYTDIQLNGYKIIYLTSRAIGESEITRNYIKNLNQSTFIFKKDNVFLPEGPIFMSPEDLVSVIIREMYYREPQVYIFKS